MGLWETVRARIQNLAKGNAAMSVDLSGSHSSIDVNDKLKTYNLFHKLMRATIVLVIAILAFMAWYLV